MKRILLRQRVARSPARSIIVVASVFSALLVTGGIWLAFTLLHQAGDMGITSVNFSPSPALQAVTARSSQIVGLRRSNGGSSPLLLFLPATGASTNLYNVFERTAAARGFHVIALPYANIRTERSLCLANAECYGSVRAEQFTGAPSLYLSTTAHYASVQASLPSAIATLVHKDPHGNWGDYMKDGAITWSNVVVAGHSQGGGLAAYIAHQKLVKGVIMFSSPNDINPRTKTIATWLGAHSETPASRYYGFMDTHDVYASSTQQSWRTMLPTVGIQKSDGVKDLSGQLLSTSSIHFRDKLTAHFAVARDSTYAPVWEYLLSKNL